MAGRKKVRKATKPSKKASSQSLVSFKPIGEKQTKSQILSSIAEETGLAKKEIQIVLESIGGHIVRHMRKRGSGQFVIPEAGIRVVRRTRPASKKRLGRNPATGEQIWIAAKPARTVVKVVPMKTLKESVNL
jgi:nucleoid DNA-binding protein